MTDINSSSHRSINARHRRNGPLSPLSPTSVIVVATSPEPFQYPRKLSDFSSDSTAPSQQHHPREYLPTVVFSPTSLSTDKQSHRRLVSYDDMEELNKKLQDLMVQQVQDDDDNDQDQDQDHLLDLSSERLNELLGLHMPSCEAVAASEAPTATKLDIPPRPLLLRSDHETMKDHRVPYESESDSDSDEESDDEGAPVEDELEVYAKQQRQHYEKPATICHADRASSNRTGKETRETEPRQDEDSVYSHTDDHLINKEITITRVEPKKTHRRKMSMFGL